MPWYPKAIKKPTTKMLTSGRRAKYDGAIYHIAASEATSLFGWWEQYPKNGGNGSHFYILRDGTVEQYADTDLVVWTSRQGSRRTVGIETQGGASGEWTAEQAEALADLTAWLWEAEGRAWPLATMADSSGRGIGWHSQGLPKFRGSATSKTGGEVWGVDPYKTCPGPDRIKQIPGIVARAIEIATPAPTTGSTINPHESEEDIDMIIYRAEGYGLGVLQSQGAWSLLRTREEKDNLLKAGAREVWVEKLTLASLINDARGQYTEIAIRES